MLEFVSFKNKYQAWGRQKYSATRRILNSLLAVWKMFYVFDIYRPDVSQTVRLPPQTLNEKN